MSTSRKPKPRPKPEPNSTPAVIDANSVYTLEELAKRARWKKHSIRQALRAGLRAPKFGSRRYVLGADAIRFFEHLADQQQAGDGDQAREGQNP